MTPRYNFIFWFLVFIPLLFIYLGLQDFEQKVRMLLEKLKQERVENDFDQLRGRTKEIVALAARKWMAKVRRARLERDILHPLFLFFSCFDSLSLN